MLSCYATSPLEKWKKSISFSWKSMAQGDEYEKAFSEVAKKWLNSPQSSVDVKRLFSTADIFRACRDQILDRS